MLQLRSSFALQLGDDALGQYLAQLDTPLIEGIDIPDRALSENVVLIKSDQVPKACGVSLSAKMVFVGRLPSQTRNGVWKSGEPSAFNSAAVLPNASASACAKTFAIR